MTGRLAIAVIALCVWAAPAGSLEIDRSGLFVRVIDVGNGHAAVIAMPGEFYMVYDAGRSGRTLVGVRSVVPDGEDIDLLILSHTDSDHIGGADELLGAYQVKRIVRPGLWRDTDAWADADAAIADEAELGAEVMNLAETPLIPGDEIHFGNARVILVSGFSQPPASWGVHEESETNNAGSIVVRLVFVGRSILFTGDSVGLKLCDTNSCAEPEQLYATELFMVKNAPHVPIDSDVLIAPHHGSRESSSAEFIAAVSPEWVVIPAGTSAYDHPHREAGERYLAANVAPSRILRTDRHDDEGDKEWPCGRVDDHVDSVGDDDVDIAVSASGDLKVAYRHPEPVSLSRCEAP